MIDERSDPSFNHFGSFAPLSTLNGPFCNRRPIGAHSRPFDLFLVLLGYFLHLFNFSTLQKILFCWCSETPVPSLHLALPSSVRDGLLSPGGHTSQLPALVAVSLSSHHGHPLTYSGRTLFQTTWVPVTHPGHLTRYWGEKVHPSCYWRIRG